MDRNQPRCCFLIVVVLSLSGIALGAPKEKAECRSDHAQAPQCLGIGGKPEMINKTSNLALNILGTELKECGRDPITGFFRDGSCQTGPSDTGVHTVCAELTQEFLDFTKSKGNDLSTPRPQFGFAGLKPGQRWCLCAARWLEAHEAGKAPPVSLEATHQRSLETVPLEALKSKAIK